MLVVFFDAFIGAAMRTATLLTIELAIEVQPDLNAATVTGVDVVADDASASPTHDFELPHTHCTVLIGIRPEPKVWDARGPSQRGHRQASQPGRA
jgi:hypothetical protein